eukprot:GHVN01057483.1.p2 GENE.GHVN01057483.1~~GHVN01057483.1.p2  ORF type:complete len:106 (-),score=9.90 GHVN01057483.1:258-575(-)
MSGQLNGTVGEMLIDTGANKLFVSPGFAEEAGIERGAEREMQTASQRTLGVECIEAVSVELGDKKHNCEATILPGLQEEVVLGREPLGKFQVKIGFQSGVLVSTP